MKRLSEEDRARESEVIVLKLGGVLDRVTEIGGVVLIYAALPLEANIWEIIHRCPGRRYALPRVLAETSSLDCWEFRNRETDLVRGAYNVLEPDPSRCDALNYSEIDLIVVPAMAYGRDGRRLGKGGGYYDRLLNVTRSIGVKSIGVGFDCQLVNHRSQLS